MAASVVGPDRDRRGPVAHGGGPELDAVQPPLRKVGMRDVARLAGVSHQTVSRVLNNLPNVSPATRGRVLDAVRVLNYRRNLAARTLVTARSRTIGLIGFETTLAGPASMIYGIEKAAREAGYYVSIATVRSLDRHSVLDAVEQLCAQAVEGIIAIAPKNSVADALTQVPAGTPAVGVGGADDGSVPMLRVDNVRGASLATRHLLELGHATVHHVPGPADWPEARDRIDGWRQTLHAAGASVPRVEPGDWSARSGYLRGQRLAVDPAVTAVFCGNDHIALGVLRAFHEAGRRVPGEVSVVGFDDTPESGYFLPPLTTVHQDFAELGRRSVELLIGQLSGAPAPAGPVHLAPHLVVRASARSSRAA
ncbi:LacI family transcriptional regulator [Dactylosporangium sucinum]|uniref:LacI family transcriptional regulator n=2 Tax=Dactylosporangium sucinum TaxID=1424081 RepID=A0A917TV26_9ACTN|nr:LacI family transcriptional regulator [Dactylosporangium sucinum]